VRVNVTVPIGPMATTAIVSAAKWRARSSRRRAHYPAHDRADRPAHGGSGHHAPVVPTVCVGVAQAPKARQPSATHMTLFIVLTFVPRCPAEKRSER
jgi:hypothetical protein